MWQMLILYCNNALPSSFSSSVSVCSNAIRGTHVHVLEQGKTNSFRVASRLYLVFLRSVERVTFYHIIAV